MTRDATTTPPRPKTRAGTRGTVYARRTPPLRAGAGLALGILGLAGAVGVACAGEGHAPKVQVRHGDCVLCHTPEYEATTMPPHLDLFPVTCAGCHGTDAWVPAVALDHDWFVLANRHTDLPCTDCHTVGFRAGDTPSACAGCHQDEYDMARMPPHAGYPTDCQACHTDAGWRPSTFAHAFTLDGAHLSTPCAGCHTGDPPVYAGTPTTCVGCHRDDYDASALPGHDTFPLACQDCHTTSAWVPALSGAHPEAEFPITRGPHGGLACLDCHDTTLGSSTNGENTSCVGCHRHERARAADQHRDVTDYVADDPNPHFCLACHPDGRKD